MENVKTMCVRAFVGLLSLGTPLLGSVAQAQTQPTGLELLERVGAYPSNLRTFEVAPPTAADLEARRALADRLAESVGVRFDGSAPGPTTEGIRLTSSGDTSAVFELDRRTGNFLFNGGLGGLRKEAPTPGLPDATKALSLAQGYLEQLALKLDPKQLRGSRAGGLNMAIPDGRGGSVIFEKLRTVRLARQIDGLPVEGDARAVVHLGEGGALQGLVFQWPALGRATPTEVGDPAALRKAARAEIERISARARSAKLSVVQLVLYDDGNGVIEPAYHFVVERDLASGDGDVSRIPYDFYLSTARVPRARYPQDELPGKAPADGRDTRPPASTGDD